MNSTASIPSANVRMLALQKSALALTPAHVLEKRKLTNCSSITSKVSGDKWRTSRSCQAVSLHVGQPCARGRRMWKCYALEESAASTSSTPSPLSTTSRSSPSSPSVPSGPNGASPLLEDVALVAGEVAEEITETVELIEKIANPIITAVEPTLKSEEELRAAAWKSVAIWTASAVAFGTCLGIQSGSGKASEFFAGYLLEQSLSVDNLFVFVLVFNYFKVPKAYQPRVLQYGIAGAVVFRGIMIIAGVTTLQRFEFINLGFAAILLFSAYKLFAEAEEEEEDLSNNEIVKFCRNFIPVSSEYDGDRFYATVDGARKATPLLLTLAVVELSDVAFAVDSIPAVFGVTRDPLIVFSSNMFAILGLRSLYTIIAGSMGELKYLQPSIAIVLGFIGSKMIADFFGFHIPVEASLGAVAGVLGGGVLLSLALPKDEQ